MNNRATDDGRARFDREAAAWDSNPVRVALARGVADAMAKAVPLRPDMSAMDFGAGTGLLTLALLPEVGRMVAVDTSGEMLRVLGAKLSALRIDHVRTLLDSADSGPLPVSGLDLVVSSMVLHHLPDVAAAFCRLRACLRVGGWIAVADLDAEDGSFHSDHTGVFHNGFDRQTVVGWLAQAGFADAAAGEAYVIARPASDGVLRRYPVFLATGRAV